MYFIKTIAGDYYKITKETHDQLVVMVTESEWVSFMNDNETAQVMVQVTHIVVIGRTT